MKTYIINLERCRDRRERMRGLLGRLPKELHLECEFMAAVDGRAMSEAERQARFDKMKFRRRYSVDVRPGEIGCTLSHQKCYRRMVEQGVPYALILEDDIRQPGDDIAEVLHGVEKLMTVGEPRVVLLSGWYWFMRTHDFISDYRLADVYDAFLTHAYVINWEAAELLIEERPFITADDWRYIRRKGVRLQAVRPHLVNQDWDGTIATEVNTEVRQRPSLSWFFRNGFRLALLKVLKFTGRSEAYA